MTRQDVPLQKLDDWLESRLCGTPGQPKSPIQLSGGFRQESNILESGLPLLELDSPAATSVRVKIPINAPSVSGKPQSYNFADSGEKWWDTWSAVLSASCLHSPVIDQKRLADLLHEKRRIRFCCDTNVLCNGVATWLLTIFNGNADIVTSAVVDRELAAWPDRTDFWEAKNMSHLHMRTHYRLGRRLTEIPPQGVVVERLSPEQGALMLAKLRDETDKKSPDADMLLVELARGLIRDQPRNARVIYLTGDRNNARAAANALGAENVLYAVSDGKLAKKTQGRVLSRGWWHPHGPLGAVIVPPISSLLWAVLGACDYIVLEGNSGKWRIEPITSVPLGVPSDWADPFLKIDTLSSPLPVSPLVDVITQVTNLTPPPATLQEAPDTSTTPAWDQPMDAPSPDYGSEVAEQRSRQEITQSAPDEQADREWLLPAIVMPSLEKPTSARPTPRIFFARLWSLLSGAELPAGLTQSGELDREAQRVLFCLGATDEAGKSGPNLEAFRQAWHENNLDWFHAQLSRIPSYRSTIDRLRDAADFAPNRRLEVNIAMARCLGQVARLSDNERFVVGDAPVHLAELEAHLNRWLPLEGMAISTDDACVHAASELHLTPARFEIAMTRYWDRVAASPFEGRTGGTVTSGPIEKVIHLDSEGYTFRDVAPGALSFGRSAPVRFIERVKDRQ